MMCGIGQYPSEHGVIHEVWVEWTLDLFGFAIRHNPTHACHGGLSVCL